MNHRKPGLMVAVLFALAGVMPAQQKVIVPEQSPRKAILEMLSGGEDAFKRHLTLEVQEKIGAMLKGSAGGMDPMQALSVARAAGGQDLESFDAGPILFSYNNAEQHERFEIRLDGDELRGGEDEMQLSLHALREGVEEDLPIALRFELSWKQQENVWRLNAITVSATAAIGDPRIFDRSRWSLAALAPRSGDTAIPPAPAAAAKEERPRLTVARAVRLIGLAENLYAQKHPKTGFTCFLSELVGVGKGLDDGEPYTFLDPEFAQGVYGGYRFSLRGCAGNPVRNYQIVAEPLSGAGRAYCADPSRDLRASDDGNGANCLASGKMVRR